MKCGKPVGWYHRECCPDCEVHPHYFDRGAAAFTYEGAMRRSVFRMKAENRRDYLDFYADAMARALEPHLAFWQPELILPVPMHWLKRRRRGYNQSELLAVRIGRLTGIPVMTRLLKCTALHTEQKSLGRRERMRNLRGTFALAAPVPAADSVLLVDDVYTTGSTVDELARLLKGAGVRHVFFLVLCIGKGKKTVCTEENVCYTNWKVGERREQNEL